MTRNTKLATFGLTAIVALATLGAVPATTQAPTPIPSVWLQSTSPGTAQTGNVNLTGKYRSTVNENSATAISTSMVGTNVHGVAAFTAGANSWGVLGQGDEFGVFGNSSSGTGVYGQNTNFGIGVRGSSPSGIGVVGESNFSFGVRGISYGGGAGIAGVYGQSPSLAVHGNATGASGTPTGVQGEAALATGFGVLGTNTTGVGVKGTTVSDVGVYGIATATSGFNYGVYGQTNSPDGRAVAGYATATSGGAYGVFGRTDAPLGYALHGWAPSTTGSAYGLHAQSDSPGGRGVNAFASSATGFAVGAWAESASSGGYGAVGLATASTGSTYGLIGQSNSSGGKGVVGQVLLTSGSTYGMFGRSDSTTGIGVEGWAPATSGINIGALGQSDSPSGRGVFGYASAAFGTTYGVRGQTNSGTGYGVYSVGELGASGFKSFRIDHPFDPENKWLLHYCSESPQPQNFYNGNVVTDAKGYAWVELPNYFAEINRDYKYQLTVLDDGDSSGFVLAKVSQEIRDNRFQIRTSEPNVKVSWRIDAVRNDRWAQAHAAPVEPEKMGDEKGKYQHPELYGKPRESALSGAEANGRPMMKPLAASKAARPRM